MIGFINNILDGPDNLAKKVARVLLRKVAKKIPLSNVYAEKVHYGSGNQLLLGWTNVDREFLLRPLGYYIAADLTRRHPFIDGCIRFGYAQDFLEHLTQAQALIFLSECYRCMRNGGVLRLSFPGLRGVLRRHYRTSDYNGAITGMSEAFTPFGHNHFFSEESLSTVCAHIGFSEIKFVEYGLSEHPELCGLDTRDSQKDLNIYAEITK